MASCEGTRYTVAPYPDCTKSQGISHLKTSQAFRRQRQKYLCGFKASQVYIASFRPERATSEIPSWGGGRVLETRLTRKSVEDPSSVPRT